MPIPPGPRLPRPLQTLGWITRPGPWMERLQARYGDAFTMRIANEGTWIFLCHPDQVREVFTGDPTLLHAGEGNAILRPFLGHRSVLLLDEGEHLHRRRLLLPPFHGERMQRYEEVMREVAEREIASWPAGDRLPLWPRMQAITLEVVMRTIFGVRDPVRLARLRERLARMLDETTRPRRLALMAVAGPARAERLRLFRRALDPVDEALFEEIRLARADPALAERDDVLSMLVQARDEAGEGLDDVDLRDQLVTLLVAGHETTATALAWAAERLVRHPGGWERVAGEPGYADAVARETLRLRPVLPLVARRLTRPARIAGLDLPAGVTLTPCIYLVHRRADVYPDPHAFRPERFLDDPPGTYTWIPFGGGVRRCLGASFALWEMRIVLEALARRVRLRAASPAAEAIVRRAITLTPGRGAEVVVG